VLAMMAGWPFAFTVWPVVQMPVEQNTFPVVELAASTGANPASGPATKAAALSPATAQRESVEDMEILSFFRLM